MVNLIKGQGISLKKEAPNLKRVLIGLGWDPIKSYTSCYNMDIDGSVICIDNNGKKDKVVSYAKLKAYSSAIIHYGDNLTGEGNGDDEQIEISLNNIPDKISKLSVIINIYNACGKNQDFSMVRNCFIRVVDLDTGKELVRYDVDGNFDCKTGIFVADIYRYNDEWKIKAIGEGVKVRDIAQMVKLKCN